MDKNKGIVALALLMVTLGMVAAESISSTNAITFNKDILAPKGNFTTSIKAPLFQGTRIQATGDITGVKLNASTSVNTAGLTSTSQTLTGLQTHTVNRAGDFNGYMTNTANNGITGWLMKDNATANALFMGYDNGGKYFRMWMINTNPIRFMLNNDGTNYLTMTAAYVLSPATTNIWDLGTTGARWKNGYIKNAWTVGDLVFNYGSVDGVGGTNYRIVEAEKLTNGKLTGLMYVMDNKAVMWIEPNGKLHTTQEIDTTWKGIDDLTFDNDGGIYKNNQVIKYPTVGEAATETLVKDYVDNKAAYVGDVNINAPSRKPITQAANEEPLEG